MTIGIDIIYIHGCTGWEPTAHLVYQVLTDLGLEGEYNYWLCESEEQAWEWDFIGSPTILIDGEDPFRGPDEDPGLGLRSYFSPQGGIVSHPTYEMLYNVLIKYVDWAA